MSVRRPRVLFYVQHLLGVGHVRRASIIARAIAAEGWACHVVLGGPDPGTIEWGDAIVDRLPAVRAKDASFKAYLTNDGQEPDAEFWASRTTAAVALAKMIEPDIVLIEQYPFGRRRFRHEIAALIEAAQSGRDHVPVLCSVRDVLVAGKSDTKNRWTVDTLRAQFDGILVHGDAAFIPFGATFPLSREIADLIHYTGYVLEPPAPAAAAADRKWDDAVVVATGGGAVGGELMSAAMTARREGLMADRRWLFLTGPSLEAGTVDRLRRSAPADVTVEPNRPDYAEILTRAHVSISQAGYNTVMDIVRARCPAVVVPLADDGETEQSYRARTLEQGGYLVSLDATGLTIGALSAAADRATGLHIPEAPPFATSGAQSTVELLREWL